VVTASALVAHPDVQQRYTVKMEVDSNADAGLYFKAMDINSHPMGDVTLLLTLVPDSDYPAVPSFVRDNQLITKVVTDGPTGELGVAVVPAFNVGATPGHFTILASVEGNDTVTAQFDVLVVAQQVPNKVAFVNSPPVLSMAEFPDGLNTDEGAIGSVIVTGLDTHGIPNVDVNLVINEPTIAYFIDSNAKKLTPPVTIRTAIGGKKLLPSIHLVQTGRFTIKATVAGTAVTQESNVIEVKT
jgi:hypothetical protein